ncbi:MAG: OmpH family outer membrane protein [Flavipsychrobacter sp.]|nr:OmpH family outer membrane protein [Flavipsychrobacter sp.]
MKNLSTILSILALAGVAALFFMKKDGGKPANTSTAAAGEAIATKIAYVNIDTLESQYEYLKDQRKKFEVRQEGMKAELQRSAQQLQNDYAAAQRKAQAGTMTEAEQQSIGKRLMQMEQSLKTREEALTVQLMKEQEEFNKKLQAQLDKIIGDFNKDGRYDYILSYTKSGSIMYANKALDITADIVKAMNDDAKNMTADTEKKNK